MAPDQGESIGQSQKNGWTEGYVLGSTPASLGGITRFILSVTFANRLISPLLVTEGSEGTLSFGNTAEGFDSKLIKDKA